MTLAREKNISEEEAKTQLTTWIFAKNWIKKYDIQKQREKEEQMREQQKLAKEAKNARREQAKQKDLAYKNYWEAQRKKEAEDEGLALARAREIGGGDYVSEFVVRVGDYLYVVDLLEGKFEGGQEDGFEVFHGKDGDTTIAEYFRYNIDWDTSPLNLHNAGRGDIDNFMRDADQKKKGDKIQPGKLFSISNTCIHSL